MVADNAMGCSSSKASAPVKNKQPPKTEIDETTSAPSDLELAASADQEKADQFDVVVEVLDEGLRREGRAIALVRSSIVHKHTGELVRHATHDEPRTYESNAVIPDTSEAHAASLKITATETLSECFRLADPADVALSASPFSSVPSADRATSNFYWKDWPAQDFMVRSLGYGTEHKKKEPSQPALYDCVAVDVLKGTKGLANLLRYAKMQDFDWWRYPDLDGSWDQTWGIPRLLIVNCLLPIHSPMGFRQKPPGCSLVAYLRLSRQACMDLKSGKVVPQIKLWQQVVQKSKSTKDGVSFKAIGQLNKKSLAELPQMLHGYNGKPVLVTESATFVKDMLPEILEIDVDVGKWAYLARQTLYSYQDVLAKHAFHVGYLVEGRTEESLPEQMLGCFCISGADLAGAMNLDSQ